MKAWLAFADERLDEIALLARAVAGGREAVAAELAASRELVAARKADPRVNDPAVGARVAALNDADARRATPAGERLARQSERLELPLLPDHHHRLASRRPPKCATPAPASRSGELDREQYETVLDEQIGR